MDIYSLSTPVKDKYEHFTQNSSLDIFSFCFSSRLCRKSGVHVVQLQIPGLFSKVSSSIHCEHLKYLMASLHEIEMGNCSDSPHLQSGKI